MSYYRKDHTTSGETSESRCLQDFSLREQSGEVATPAEPAARGREREADPGTRAWEDASSGAECARSDDRSLWPDAWLVAAVHGERPDQAALNVLAVRFGPPLSQRCLRLTGNWDKARDLVQETWCRLLRTRRTLLPEKSFPAYLTTVATNIWRDKYRAARRAGAMAEHRLVPLDGAAAHVDGGRGTLAEAVPDARGMETQARRLRLEELHLVLAVLSPTHRDVLLARFLRGESCALIGRRYARTEQTISGWVREALDQARCHLAALDRVAR